MKTENKIALLLISLILTFLCLPFDVNAKEQYEPCPVSIKGEENTIFGSYIKNLKTGEIIDNLNSDFLFVPASVTKALTCASVLSQIPEDARFKTTVELDGPYSDGHLDGNLIICCTGDPTIESSQFKSYAGLADSIANALSNLGIKTIAGRIEFEYPFELEDNIPEGWMNEDLIWPYGAAHHAVNYADNRLILNLTDETTIPPTSELVIKRESGKTLAKPRNENYIIAPLKRKGSVQIAAPSPKDVFTTAIREALNNNNIALENHKLSLTDNRRVIYTHKSPTYGEIMKSLMWRSDNLMAEGILRTLSPSRWRKSATQRELSLWNARGLDVSGIYVEDGSGLSRKNRISPKFLGDVFEWMTNNPDKDLFLSMFPRAGKEGTMRNFMKDTPLDGIMATKTGSMRGVQCFAGYILDTSGNPTHVITIMVNAFTCNRDSLKKAIGNYILTKLGLNNDTTENDGEN